MPAIKGGCIDRAHHKSEIEEMIDRAAAAPGPGEVFRPSTHFNVAYFLHGCLSIINTVTYAAIPPNQKNLVHPNSMRAVPI